MESNEIFDLDLKLKLINNIPVYANVGYIYPLTIKEISLISYSLYNMYLLLLSSTTKKLKDLEIINDECELDTYDWIIVQCAIDGKYKKYILDGLALFFKEEVIFDKNNLKIYIGEESLNNYLTKDIFQYMQQILIKMYCIDNSSNEEEKPIFGNKVAEEMWLKIQKNNKKVQMIKNNKKSLVDIISGVAWKSRLGINTVCDMSIYQLYDAYQRLNLIDDVELTLDGIYHGTIDGSKTKYKELDWSKSIDINNN